VTVRIDVPPAEAAPPGEEEHWGKSLVRLLDELGPLEFVDPEITDPVEWVKAQRQKEADRLKPYWDGKK